MQQTIVKLGILIVADGMLTAEEFDALVHFQRVRYLATLDVVQLRAQASVLAVARLVSVEYIVGGWIAQGLVSHERAISAMMVRGHAISSGRAA